MRLASRAKCLPLLLWNTPTVSSAEVMRIAVDLPEKDWNGYFAGLEREKETTAAAQKRQRDANRRPEVKATLPLASYTGDVFVYAFQKLGAGCGAISANAAASLNGSLRVALGCVDAVPVVVEPASSDEAAVREAVRGLGLTPPSDVHASSEYRTHLAEVLAVRAARQAAGRS